MNRRSVFTLPVMWKNAWLLCLGLIIACPAWADVPFLQAQIKAGDMAAANKLGDAYYYGREGAGKDKSKAVAYYRLAAEGGNSEGQYNLGYCYLHGVGVQANAGLGMEWLRKSSTNGYTTADYEIGMAARDGVGVEKQPRVAEQWLLKAAQAGNQWAQRELGRLYLGGYDGVARDEAKARLWLGKSVAQGNAEAAESLAKLAVAQKAPSSPILMQAAISVLKRYVVINNDLSDVLPASGEPSYPFSYGSGDWGVFPLSEAVNGARAKYDWKPYQSRPYVNVFRTEKGERLLGVKWSKKRVLTDVYGLYSPNGYRFDIAGEKAYWMGKPLGLISVYLEINRDLAPVRASVLNEGEIEGVRWAVRLDCVNKVKCIYRSYDSQDGEFSYVDQGGDQYSVQLSRKEDNMDRKLESAAVIYFYEDVDRATRQRVADAIAVLANSY